MRSLKSLSFATEPSGTIRYAIPLRIPDLYVLRTRVQQLRYNHILYAPGTLAYPAWTHHLSVKEIRHICKPKWAQIIVFKMPSKFLYPRRNACDIITECRKLTRDPARGSSLTRVAWSIISCMMY